MSARRRRAVVLAAGAALLLSSPGAGRAAVHDKILALPAQPLASALQSLARQTGVNILFLPDSVRGLQSQPVFGAVDAEDAARAMVAGAPLKVVRNATGGLIVFPLREPQAPSAPAPSEPARANPARPVALPSGQGVQPLELTPTVLAELLVTATRQIDTVNRVPLSITAETQAGLDQRGLQVVQDLQATVPALRVIGSTGAGAAIIAIRGIQQTGPTAATTGFYLDDVPLQRRSSGSAGGVNGTPLPLLFDLDRVEVLRGPQGTLFGSGSEGGTIRYIQPQPSLTRYSTYLRAEIGATHDGSPSGGLGVAVGGPIVPDKLGFRASVLEREVGGYIDLVDPFTGQVWKPDANSQALKSARLAFTWAPTARLKATLSAVDAHSMNDHALDRMTLPIDQPIVVPTLCYNTGQITSLPISSASRTTPVPVGHGDAECAAARAAGNVTYQTPGYTLGPYHLQPYQAIENDVTVVKQNFRVYSLDLDYDLDGVEAKSITAYSQDSPKQSAPQPFQVNRVITAVNLDPADPRNAHVGDIVIPSSIPFIPFLGPEGFKGPAHFTSVNPRYSFTQEIRLSSRPEARPVSWVAGVFFSNIRAKPNITLLSDSNDYSLAQFGITDVQRYGIRSLPSAPGIYNVFAKVDESLKDTETAAFGEVDYWPTDRWKLIAGVRVSRVGFDYRHAEIGPSNGLTVATVENGGLFMGSVRETPITPHFGAQYFFSPDDNVYVSAAKGYRAGGVNTPVAQSQAGDSLARNFGTGFTVADLPRTYNSDSVWSYEIGVKTRLWNRLQLNGAIFTVDWKNPQVSTLIPQSGATVTTNAIGARSRGLELEAEAALTDNLSATAALGYTKAYYTRQSVAFTGLNGVQAVSTLAGQQLPLPPFTLSLGVRQDFRLGGAWKGYVRGDWRYSAPYELAPFGATTWNPDSNDNPASSQVNLRSGVVVGDWELNLYVNNLFEPHTGPVSGGRTGCALPAAGGTPACDSYSAYEVFRYTSWGRPREIGLQLLYRR